MKPDEALPRIPVRLGALFLFCCLVLAVSAGAVAGETIQFDSVTYPPTPFSVARAKQRGIALQPAPRDIIEGELYRPPGAGPFPAVVLMHGCGGRNRWNGIWTAKLTDWGYLVFDVDSFGPRGIDNGCRNDGMAGPLRRALDAHGARRALAALPYVSADRIAVMGMSHGGASTLWAIDRRIGERIEAKPFRAAVMFYPACDPYSRPNAPALILIGELDKATEPAYCERYLARLGAGHAVTLKIYQGVYHGFDIEGIDSSWGPFINRYDETAAKDAFERVRAFLERHLRSVSASKL